VFPALVLLLTCCDRASEEPLAVDAVVAFPPRDTIRFSLPAATHRCSAGRSFILEAVSPEGSGVLMRLHYLDSLVTASYPIVMPGETTTAGATVAVRYLLRDVGHAFVFDTGSVELRREGTKIDGRIQGAGMEAGIRTPTRIEYHDVSLPLASDSVSCVYTQP